jgi:hypothetical protein
MTSKLAYKFVAIFWKLPKQITHIFAENTFFRVEYHLFRINLANFPLNTAFFRLFTYFVKYLITPEIFIYVIKFVAKKAFLYAMLAHKD